MINGWGLSYLDSHNLKWNENRAKLHWHTALGKKLLCHTHPILEPNLNYANDIHQSSSEFPGQIAPFEGGLEDVQSRCLLDSKQHISALSSCQNLGI